MNPFDDESLDFVVLRNDDDQHSLWPAAIDTPGGWHVVLARSSRQDCLDFIEREWVDMRPRGLREATSADR